MSEEFNLPGSSYAEVSKIIQGYASIGKPASRVDVSKAIGIDPTTISRNAKFLVSIGVLEGGNNKSPTSLGALLGNALGHRLINAQPDACCCEFDEGEEVGIMFLVSSRDSPVMFEL